MTAEPEFDSLMKLIESGDNCIDTLQSFCSSVDVVGVVMEARWAGHAEMNTQRTAVLCFLLGNSPASEFYMSVPSS